MPSVNKVILVGNLGNEPETRYMPSGDAVTNISLATTDRYKDKTSGEMKESTEWHRVAFFGRIAEVAAEYLHKGSPVYIEGRIRTRKWQDQSGQDKYSTEIVAENMQLLGGGNGGGQDRQQRGYDQPRAQQHNRGHQPRPQGEQQHAGYGSHRGGQQQRQQPPQRQQQSSPSNGFEDMDDDIPF